MGGHSEHRHTLKRIEGHNHARSLTFSCFQNRPFLRSRRACLWFVDALRMARERHAMRIWAWVAMPTHVHLLVYPSDTSKPIGPFLSTMKQSVAKRAIAWLERESPTQLRAMEDVSSSGSITLRFWQRGGGYDRNLVTPRAIRNEIAYIHTNPVRAELCARREEWEWSSAREHAAPGSGPVPIDQESLRHAIAQA